jgi:hypothetical protein
MCPFLHWGVDSSEAESFEFPVDWDLNGLLAKIFSHSMGCLLSLVTIYFTVQKLLNFIPFVHPFSWLLSH